MMWRRVDRVHSFLPLVSIATSWCVVYAQSDTDGPSSTSPVECIGRPCARYWWTSMWGFIVTLVALTMDVWGYGKSFHDSTTRNVFNTFFMSALNPLILLWYMLANTMLGIPMLSNLREAFGDDVIAPLYPWRKSHIKIISGSHVIVNLSPDVHIQEYYLDAYKGTGELRDLSEALVIGTKVVDSEHFNVELIRHGELALLRSNVLPPYDEPKFLGGHSSLDMVIANAQAIGYIYGVVVCCVQGLQVSPIEAIACVLNMVILMKGVFHNFASLGHRPLLLYLLPEEEARFIEECKKVQDFVFKFGHRLKLGVLIASGVLLAMGAYFITNFLKSLTILSVVPIILFEVSLVVGVIQGFTLLSNTYRRTLYKCVIFPIVLLNLVVYMWAVVVTFK